MEEASDCYARLARAKLATMFQDLGGMPMGCTPGEKEFVRQAACRWFLRESDFEAWCVMAELCPIMVREKARKVEAEGLSAIKWRADPSVSPRYEYRRQWRMRRKRLQAA